MLEGDVQVGTDLVLILYKANEFMGKGRGVSIEDPDPEPAGQAGDIAHQIGKAIFFI